MELLLFSDLHRDREAAQNLVEVAQNHPIDVAIGAGDFASVRVGIEDVLSILRDLPCPAVLVAGNAETDEELRQAAEDWQDAHVLHGQSVQINGVTFFGLGGAVPVTPFGSWSFDLDEATAAAMLGDCPDDAVLVTHSPPRGVVDTNRGGTHLGSQAIREAIECRQLRLAVCGHIHDCWESEGRVGATPVVNAGPRGMRWSLNA